MVTKSGARLHMEGVKIVDGQALELGDFVSTLPYLWQNIGVVCQWANAKCIVYLNLQKRAGTSYENLQMTTGVWGQQFAVIPSCAVVPFLDPDTFNAPNPTENAIALVGDKVAVIAWVNFSYILFDAATGLEIDRLGSRPVFVTSWDLLAKDVDDDVVSLLEVRP